MAGVRAADLQFRPTEFQDCTSLTRDAFLLLVPPFEAAFQAHRAAWRLDGTPRTAASVPSLSTAPCRPQKLGCGLSWPPSQPLCSRSCTGACLGWARASPTSGCPSSCPCCTPHR
jgi:hypothetical protein